MFASNAFLFTLRKYGFSGFFAAAAAATAVMIVDVERLSINIHNTLANINRFTSHPCHPYMNVY